WTGTGTHYPSAGLTCKFVRFIIRATSQSRTDRGTPLIIPTSQRGDPPNGGNDRRARIARTSCRTAKASGTFLTPSTETLAVIGVSIHPGQMVVHRTPWGFNSTRSASMSALTPALLAQYPAIRGTPQ